jgi:protein TonB
VNALTPSRIGALAALGLHAALAAAILSYQPARSALLAAAPIMVDWITTPRAEPKIEPPAQQPKPRPVHKVKPVEQPIVTAPPQAPNPVVAPAPPPAPPAPIAAAPAPEPIAVTAPVFSANYLENPAPGYPPMSRRLHEEGKVILRVHVDPGGKADEVVVRTSSGFSRLDDTARETVRLWKFVPAKRGAEPVAAWVLIPISFKLDS